jgi:glycosyltransferase involved in cell wall biosynthesis
MRIIIATDAWLPQINGVSRTLQKTVDMVRERGHTVEVIHPGLFTNYKCPFSPDVRLAWGVSRIIPQTLQKPFALHIPVEGPIGIAFRNYCVENKIPFTTSYHTNFPEYLWNYAWIPLGLTRIFVKWFHKPSAATMVSTNTLRTKLNKIGIKNTKIWGRGTDPDIFKVRDIPEENIALYVGRISQEKNIEKFLSLPDIKHNGFVLKKYVTGNGEDSYLSYLKRKYPNAVFTGPLHGQELGEMYSRSKLFVFPSKTDTFGLVIIEALASGKPVAAYPVEGPIDIIGNTVGAGCCHDDLEVAVNVALNTHSKEKCLLLASNYTWEKCTSQFINNLVECK